MKFWREFIMLSGFAMLLLGVWFFKYPAKISISFTGIVMIASGLLLLANYLNDHHDEKTIKWVLADGIITFLLGAFLFLNKDATTQAHTITFAAWVLFSGMIRIIAGFKARELHIFGWLWILTIGGITVILGFIPLSDLVSSLISAAATIGLFLIIQGMNTLITFYFLENIQVS